MKMERMEGPAGGWQAEAAQWQQAAEGHGAGSTKGRGEEARSMARTEKEGVPKCAGLAAKEGGRLRMVLREQVTEAGCAEGTDRGHTGTHRLYSGSSSSSRWHKQAAQGPVSLNGPEQK